MYPPNHCSGDIILGKWVPENIKELERLRDLATLQGKEWKKVHDGWEDREKWVRELLESVSEEEFIKKANKICNGNLCAFVVKQVIDRSNGFPVRHIALAERIDFNEY